MPPKINKKEMESKRKEADVVANKNIACLSYVWILFLVPLIVRPKSKFCQFHAKQGFILFMLSIFSAIPLIGWLFGVALIVTSIIAIMKTLDGEWWQMPYIFKISKKI